MMIRNKQYLTKVELITICLALYLFYYLHEYLFPDPIFWFRCKWFFPSYFMMIYVRYDERMEELEEKRITLEESNKPYEMVTIYDWLWVFILLLSRFLLPEKFFPDILNFFLN